MGSGEECEDHVKLKLPWLRKRYRYSTREGLIGGGKLRSALILQSLDCVYPRSNSMQFHPCLDWHGLLFSRYIAEGKTTNLFSNHHLERLAFHPQLHQAKMEAQQSYLFIHTCCSSFNFTWDQKKSTKPCDHVVAISVLISFANLISKTIRHSSSVATTKKCLSKGAATCLGIHDGHLTVMGLGKSYGWDGWTKMAG